jgi:hypothetical protein
MSGQRPVVSGQKKENLTACHWPLAASKNPRDIRT